jgi:hypothetical protein
MNKSSRTRAVFCSPEDLAGAVEALHKLKAELIEICSPIPLPEFEELIPRRPSPVRWFTLFGCISGALFGFWLQIFSVLSYPLPVGGKPIVSISAFIVIAFELTILFGAVATIVGFFLYSRLPRFKEEAYHLGCSQSDFALTIRHAPSETEHISASLVGLGASEVTPLDLT